MPRAPLGATGITVSRLCFGTLTMGPLQRALPPRQGADFLVYAYERGVNFADTAELYGTYEHLRLALAHARDLQICTKAYCYDEATAEKSLFGALKALRTERVALFLLHEQESVHTLRGHERALRFLERQAREGRVGAVGISTHCVPAVEAAPRFPGIQVIHPLINRAGIGIQGGSLSDMERAVQAAHGAGIGVFAMKALGGGHLIADARAAFSYLLQKPYIDSVAVGMQSSAEIDVNVALFQGALPSESALARCDRQPRSLMVQDWCTGCGACAARCGALALSVADGRARVDASRCVRCGYCAQVCPEFCLKVI